MEKNDESNYHALVTLLRLGLFASTLVFTATGAELLGTISGTAKGPVGEPVASAIISYLRMAPLNQSAPSRALRVTSDAKGAFTLTGIAAGSYMLCVQTPSTLAWLDPCQWSDDPLIVSVAPGQQFANIVLRVQKAVVLKIHVTDASGLVSANEGKIPGGHLVVGTWTKRSIFLDAALASQTKNSRILQIAVPDSVALKIGVQSGAYVVKEQGGATIAGSVLGNSLVIPAGTTQASINLTVTGLAPVGTIP